MSLIEKVYKGLVRPRIFAATKDNAELAHEWGLQKLIKLQESYWQSWLARRFLMYRHPMIATDMAGIKFPTPFGLAAGFDKYCRIYHGAIPLCGWGFCEVGGITLEEQPGNSGVRMLRSEKYEALWNCMGFNNPGAKKASSAMMFNPSPPPIPVGLNVGKGKDTPIEKASTEYAEVVTMFLPYVDFIVLNPSSPNTVGLRALQSRPLLQQLITDVQRAVQLWSDGHGMKKHKPIGIKVAPDMTKETFAELLDVCISACVEFVVLTNTTTQRDLCKDWSIPQDRGGVSGQPLRSVALDMTKSAYRHIKSRKSTMRIVGVGGINSPESLYERIRAGASVCQAYTAWPFEGPDFAKRCCVGLVRLLKRDGLDHISQAVGQDAQ